ncbi:MAG: hypothetical protein NTV82_01490, partial [Candidatus Aminicenantes bacterium]|nr:hypothetical protein [Candidatus Aminicenantes bacterium]
IIVRNDSEGPRVMAEGGLLDILRKGGFYVGEVSALKLTPEEEKEYGEWNRDALESRHIGRLVSGHRLNEGLVIGLLTNCVDLLGMLAGLQHLGPPAATGIFNARGWPASSRCVSAWSISTLTPTSICPRRL